MNADGCRARQARSCKNIACRGGIPKSLVVSLRLQRLDDLQNLHNFRTVAGCYYCIVLNFAAAYSRAFVLLDVCKARAFVCFALTSAGLEQMKHVKVFGGRLQRVNVFGG